MELWLVTGIADDHVLEDARSIIDVDRGAAFDEGRTAMVFREHPLRVKH